MKEGDVAYAYPTILGYPCRYTPVSLPQNPYTSGGSVSFPHGSPPMFPTATRAWVPSLTSIPCLPEPRAPSPNFALPSGVCTIPAVTVPRFALIADSGSTSMASALTAPAAILPARSEEHTSELQSRENLVCRLLLEK